MRAPGPRRAESTTGPWRRRRPPARSARRATGSRRRRASCAARRAGCTRGSCRNAIARRMRCRWPFDMRSTRRSANSSNPNRCRLTATSSRASLAGHVCQPRPVVELLGDAHARLQAAVAGREEADLPSVAPPFDEGVSSPMRTLPRWGSRMPAARRRSVVLPTPLRPPIQVTSPARKVRLTSSRTGGLGPSICGRGPRARGLALQPSSGRWRVEKRR